MAEAPVLHLDGLRIGRRGHHDPDLDGLTLRVEPGQTQVIVGPLGSGADAIAPALAGNPSHPTLGGRILLRGDDITAWPTPSRSRAGLLVAFGRPPAMAGVTLAQIMGPAVAARTGAEVSRTEIRADLAERAKRIGAAPSLLDAELGDDRSAVEIRQVHLLQMLTLDPELVVVDEPDDAMAQEVVSVLSRGLASVRVQRPTLGTLVVTQCRRLLDQLTPDCVHILVGGRIVATGGPELADRLRTEGYESFT